MYGNVLYSDDYEGPIVIAKESARDVQQEPDTRQAVHSLTPTDFAKVNSPDELYQQIHTCTNCALGFTRTNFVFGSGNPNAHIMVIGEAPGADEDEQGLPFVGRAGQLLTKVLEAINLTRDEVYICNILKCRPPNNRKPLLSETDQCEPYLWKQIELIKPRFILALGLTAANTLLKNKESMTNLRGKIHDYQGIKTLVTYHPAALLRNPEWKKLAWEDVKLLRTLYDAS
ncbi:MAG: uracil-DNA glycosylase [Candidatus Kapabacteria bacterium]|nr:uracil-DNA glycosylase [Candidatus Kapabacteria bacterium]